MMPTPAPLTLALPSKGRMREALDEFLTDNGFRIASVEQRGYLARLKGLIGADVQLLSASEIAGALAQGQVHAGVTGEDLLQESALAPTRGAATRPVIARRLGFAKADVVVAAPEAWLDVDHMADLDALAQERRATHGRALQVATKYTQLARRHFRAHRVHDYEIVPSAGATEGAPAAGLADVIVDITTTGRTLAANALRVLSDGLILRSEACLALSPAAIWSPEACQVADTLLARLAARRRARTTRTLHAAFEEGHGEAVEGAARAWDAFVERRASGVSFRVDLEHLDAAAASLLKAGAVRVRVQDDAYLFEQPGNGEGAQRVEVLIGSAPTGSL